MTINRALRIVLAVLLTVTVSACGSSGTSGTGSSAPPSAPGSAAPVSAGSDPCAYVTAQAAQRFGSRVKYPGTREQELDFGPSCDYGIAVFTLVRKDVSGGAFKYGMTKAVPGVGDHAYYGFDYHWLRVAKANTRFELRCRLCDGDELAAMTAVAESVVARIP